MHFDRRSWRLEHRCTSSDCPWTLEKGLPFHIVDDEIYRFLPSVVVGTLDKAASVAIQAAQRGLYASPIARCSRDGHGFTYAPRKESPQGCQVPGCKEPAAALGQELQLFAPTVRVQDELHLLRDSLGAMRSAPVRGTLRSMVMPIVHEIYPPRPGITWFVRSAPPTPAPPVLVRPAQR